MREMSWQGETVQQKSLKEGIPRTRELASITLLEMAGGCAALQTMQAWCSYAAEETL